MIDARPGAMSYSRSLLRALVTLNRIYGTAIVALLVVSLVAERPVMDALGVGNADGRDTLIAGMRAIMAVGIVAAVVTDTILSRLLSMVETVRAGDPFIPENATRLRTIAWSLLALELLHLIVGATAAWISTEAQPLDVNWRFSLTPWVAVLLLLVLARVFEHGTGMRADLEGTV